MKCLHTYLRNNLLYAVFIIVLSCAPSASTEENCSDELGCIVVAPGDTLQIGVIQDLSGGAMEYGNLQLNAIKLALEHRGGKILGHPVELVIEDELCSAEGGKNAALKLTTNPKIVGILGTTCSGAALTASKIVSESGMLMISGANSASSLTVGIETPGKHWNEGYFRTTTNDVYRGKSVAFYAYNVLGLRKAATLDDGDAYTRGAVEVFRQEFKRLGGEIVFSGVVDKGDTNMEPILTSVTNTQTELLYFPLFAPEGLSTIKFLASMEQYNDIVLFTSNTVLNDDSQEYISSQVSYPIYVTRSVELNSDIYQSFYKAYTEAYGRPAYDTFAPAYDSANLLFDVIEQTSEYSIDGTIVIGRKALRNALYSIRNYQGVSGVLSCDEYGDLGEKKSRIMVLRPDKTRTEEVFIYTKDL